MTKVAPTSESRRVGFIGLGQMGHGMATNLVKHGFQLTVMAHTRRVAIDELVAAGAREVASPAEMAAQCDVIILCVANAEQVRDLVTRNDGIASTARDGLIVIDCTTSSPQPLEDLQQEYTALVFVDAPLGRSPAEARGGTLSTLVGATPEIFAQIQPILNTFADTVQLIGPLGSGHKLKLVNNFVSLGYAAIYAEALTLALRSGLSIENFDQLITTSRMDCRFYRTFMSWTLEGDSSPHRFSLNNADHTIRDVEDLSRRMELGSELAGAIGGVYHRAIEHNMGTADLPELTRSTALDGGIELRPLTRPL